MSRDPIPVRTENDVHGGTRLEGRGPSTIRVCLVGPSMDILGGQAVQVTRLLRRLQELDGIEVSFLAVNPRLPGPLRMLQRIKYMRTVVTSAAYVASLLGRLRECDIVHAFSASYSSYLLAPLPAMIVARLFGKRIVLNYRSGQAEDHLGRSPFAVRTMRLADAIVVPSGYLVEVFAKFRLPATPILNFVDLDAIDHRERTTVKPLLLSNRNLEALYNVECTLRAFEIIQNRHPDARLAVVGDGGERPALERLVKELGLRHVEFVGRVRPERMRDFYGAADIYVNSPNIDNMPNSVIEAFAAGLPVVTTNAGGIPFIVTDEETALMVERGDHQSLAGAVIRMLEEPGLAARLSARAREVCLRRYVWTAVAVQWDALYRELMRGRGDLHPPRAGDSSVLGAQ